jgi:hypothetical protein
LGLKGSLLRNGSDGIQRVPSIFVPQNKILVIFSYAEDSESNSNSSFYFCTTERNSELFSLPCGRVRNGILRVFCSAEQLEFRLKYLFVPAIPSSVVLFFCWKFPTLVPTPPDILLKSCGLFTQWLLILYPMKLSNSFQCDATVLLT